MAGPRFLVPQWVEEGSFFTMATGIYPWMVAVILARELLVTGFRGEAEAMGVSFASNWFGKAKMILQSITVPTVIFFAITFKTGEDRTISIAAKWFCYVLVYLTVVVTIVSGLPYVLRLRRITANRDNTNDAGS